jgi:hypothetical protein
MAVAGRGIRRRISIPEERCQSIQDMLGMANTAGCFGRLSELGRPNAYEGQKSSELI